jgi:hypothetical protein
LRFDDDEPTSVKRVRRRALPSIEEFDAIVLVLTITG